MILVLISPREQKRDKSKIATKFVGIIVSCKSLSQILCKIFSTQCFFTDHSKYKMVNKTTCRTTPANPHQLCANWLKSFLIAMIIFWGFQDLLIYLGKYFWSLLTSPNLIFQLLFYKSNVNKSSNKSSKR